MNKHDKLILVAILIFSFLVVAGCIVWGLVANDLLDDILKHMIDSGMFDKILIGIGTAFTIVLGLITKLLLSDNTLGKQQ
jgi:Na+-translocating ferredoxin:NAD+ oxidoreductase RnfE subunit